MTNGKPARQSVFTGLLLIAVGVLFLLHNLKGYFDVWYLFERWWPVLLIIWGLAKLYDHLAARRMGQAAPRTVTGGEIALVIVVLALAASLAGIDHFRTHGRLEEMQDIFGGVSHDFNEPLPVKRIPADARITARTDRGDITVHAEDDLELRVVAKKIVRGSSENEAKRRAEQVSVTITEDNGIYEVRPQGQQGRGQRVQVDLELHVPRRAALNARTERGNVQISGIGSNVNVDSPRGDVEVRDAGGDVVVDAHRGDVHIVGARGNVKLGGRGGQVEIADIQGEAAVEGEFFGPIRIEKAAKGAHFASQRTDLTVTQLTGRIETSSSGRLEITDAPGNVTLTTKKYDITLENVRGRIHIENRDGNIELRYPEPPRETVEVNNASGNIEVVLPGKSSFEVHAESKSGDIQCEFDKCSPSEKEGRRLSTLDWKQGGKGPQITLRTTYGDIRLRKNQ